MAENPLIKKLRIQPGQQIAILNAPENYRATLGELPEDVTVSEEANGRFDLVHLFVSSSVELERLGPAAIDAQYSGGKAALRPIYERISAIVTGFGNDVESGARKTYVAFSRGRQFALFKSSAKRIDVGLKLNDVEVGGRLETANNVGSGSMSHKVTLSSLDEVDDELVGWLRQAYDEVY